MAKNKINYPKLNLTIDFIMFVVLMAVAGIGMLIRFILVPGFKRNEIYGADTELVFMGLDRHQWGAIHMVLSILLIILLVLHIVFHWDQICCILKRMVKKKSGRTITWIASVLVLIIFGILPFFIQPTVIQGISHDGHYRANQNRNSNLTQERTLDLADTTTITDRENQSPSEKNRKQHFEKQDIDIKGSMTLNEVAQKYKAPVSELAAHIKVPENYANERLGRLRKQYGFSMNDLREYIISKTSNHD